MQGVRDRKDVAPCWTLTWFCQGTMDEMWRKGKEGIRTEQIKGKSRDE